MSYVSDDLVRLSSAESAGVDLQLSVTPTIGPDEKRFQNEGFLLRSVSEEGIVFSDASALLHFVGDVAPLPGDAILLAAAGLDLVDEGNPLRGELLAGEDAAAAFDTAFVVATLAGDGRLFAGENRFVGLGARVWSMSGGRGGTGTRRMEREGGREEDADPRSARFGELLAAGDWLCTDSGDSSPRRVGEGIKEVDCRLLSVSFGSAGRGVDGGGRDRRALLLVDADGDGRVGECECDPLGSCTCGSVGLAGDRGVWVRVADSDEVVLDMLGGGSSQSSSKLSGDSSFLTPFASDPSPRKAPTSRFGVDTGDRADAAVLAFVGNANSKSSSQFSVTTLRRGFGVTGTTGAAATGPPPDDMFG